MEHTLRADVVVVTIHMRIIAHDTEFGRAAAERGSRISVCVSSAIWSDLHPWGRSGWKAGGRTAVVDANHHGWRSIGHADHVRLPRRIVLLHHALVDLLSRQNCGLAVVGRATLEGYLKECGMLLLRAP